MCLENYHNTENEEEDNAKHSREICKRLPTDNR